MEIHKKKRGSYRSRITRICADIEQLCDEEILNIPLIQAKGKLLESIHVELVTLNNLILEDMVIADNVTEQQLNEEGFMVDDYSMKFEVVMNMVRAVVHKNNEALPEIENLLGSPTSSRVGSFTQSNVRQVKLPKIELAKFDGNLRNWLRFWAQFEDIHNDPSLKPNHKFHYLIQAMEKDTEPFAIVTSYPITAACYEEAVQDLKKRYGNEDVLLQVYLRDLLRLVITNATSKRKMPLSELQVKLETQLRALDTLNLKAAEPSSWLFPLIESCLTEELLRTWQRSSLAEDVSNRLPNLRKFLSQEIQRERKIQLASSGFMEDSVDSKKNFEKKSTSNHLSKKNSTPTAAALHTSNVEKSCIFCKKPHSSSECGTASEWSLDEKKQIIKQKNVCFICLKPGHSAKNCKAFIKCIICKKRHTTLMCTRLAQWEREDTDKASRSSTPESKGDRKSSSTSAAVSNQICTEKVLLQTLLVEIRGADKKRHAVRAFIDSGSQYSYITKKTARRLRLSPVKEETVQHSVFGGDCRETYHQIYAINIFKLGARENVLCKVRDQNQICANIPKVDVANQELRRQLKKARIWINDMQQSKEDSTEVELLLGADVYPKILTGKTVNLPIGPKAIETTLGWTLLGELNCEQEDSETTVANSILVTTLCDLSLENFWNLETIGITDPSEKMGKQEQDESIKIEFQKSMLRTEEGRYTVPLSWKEGRPELPSNKETALARMKTTLKKLEKSNMMEAYDKVFREWEEEGFIEDVTNSNSSSQIHYLPHRPVFRPDNLTTPVRPVFDASCKTSNGFSLNDCLETGPNLVQLLLDVLLRFRLNKIGVISDIRKAFLMIEIQEQDRGYLRFLWIDQHKNVKELQHIRLPFGATCSPFILAAVLDHHLDENLKNNNDKILDGLKKMFYVDNCVTSVNSLEEYDHFRTVVSRIFSEMKMDLRGWQRSGEDFDIKQKVLGLIWNKLDDTLKIPIRTQELSEPVTKRKILSSVQKLFDPLGVLSLVLLPPKLMLQEIWKSESGTGKTKRMSWDREVSAKIADKFKKWQQQICLLNDLEIPRGLSGSSSARENWQFHVFSDASADAYAAVIFLRVEEENQVFMQLVLAKTRVAPIKPITIPRLELLGCLLATRLMKTVKTALQLERVPTYFWTDSSTALSWIQRSKIKWGVFVQNRVEDIRKNSKVEQWRHVPGVLNPADLPSRGCSVSQLMTSRWWEGPDWLRLSQDRWPQEPVDEIITEDEISAEARKTVVSSHVITDILPDKDMSYSMQIRIMAWIWRFYNNLKRSIDRRNLDKELSTAEVNNAEVSVLLQVQKEAFPEVKNVINGIIVKRDIQGLWRT